MAMFTYNSDLFYLQRQISLQPFSMIHCPWMVKTNVRNLQSVLLFYCFIALRILFYWQLNCNSYIITLLHFYLWLQCRANILVCNYGQWKQGQLNSVFVYFIGSITGISTKWRIETCKQFCMKFGLHFCIRIYVKSHRPDTIKKKDFISSNLQIFSLKIQIRSSL